MHIRDVFKDKYEHGTDKGFGVRDSESRLISVKAPLEGNCCCDLLQGAILDRQREADVGKQ